MHECGLLPIMTESNKKRTNDEIYSEFIETVIKNTNRQTNISSKFLQLQNECKKCKKWLAEYTTDSGSTTIEMEEKKVVELTEKIITQEIINNYKDILIIELKNIIFGLIIQNNSLNEIAENNTANEIAENNTANKIAENNTANKIAEITSLF